MNWIYEHNDNNSARFTLGEYLDMQSRTLLCFGINPSTATPDNLDKTINKIKALAQFNGYTNWVMLNLYPQRATNPKDLHMELDAKLCADNLAIIKRILVDFVNAAILFAYGDLISKRSYLEHCLTDILTTIKSSTFFGQYLCIKTTKQGNPIHPLYQKSSLKFTKFNICLCGKFN